MATPTITPLPTPTPTPLPVTADILLTTTTPTVALGQQFTVDVVIQASPTCPVDAVQVFVDFDPALLRAIHIQDGPYLEVALRSETNGHPGRIDYAAGTVQGAVDFPFVLATVTFQALRPSGINPPAIRFAPQRVPRHTKAVAAGLDVTGDLLPLPLSIN